MSTEVGDVIKGQFPVGILAHRRLRVGVGTGWGGSNDHIPHTRLDLLIGSPRLTVK